MRATLAQFPVNDTLLLLNQEVVASLEGSDDDSVSSNTTSSENRAESDHDGSKIEQSKYDAGVMARQNKHHHPIENANDKYSPGFLLPLILGALESGLSVKSEESNSRMDVDEETPPSEPDFDAPFSIQSDLALIAHGLCEKGGLALAIAALCSSCARIRQVAVSILTLFLLALESQEAKELSSWRERPQILMVLHSLRRGLLSRMSSKVSTTGKDSLQSEIPRLPVAVALFLARSSLVVTKPEDFLYVSINRFFLKSEIDGGAFQDMNRIPGFVSLFCSSNDDPFQARKERLWALHLLQDSTLDSHSYALVASCHAPELIISSIDNFRSRENAGDKEGLEVSLILQVLTGFISNGGFKAFRHLVGRMGLLSWVRTIFIGRPIFHILPSSKSRQALLRLVKSAADAAVVHGTTRKDVLVQELIALPELLIQLALHGTPANTTKSKGSDRQSTEHSLLLRTTCESIRSIVAALELLGLGNEERWEYCDSSGLSLVSCCRFLDHFQGVSSVETVSLLSNIPVRFDKTGAEAATLLCSRSLAFCFSEPGTEIQVSILKRISQLSKLYGSQFDTDGSVLLQLITNSHRAASSTDNRNQWQKCIKSVLDNHKDKSESTLPLATSPSTPSGISTEEIVAIAHGFLQAEES